MSGRRAAAAGLVLVGGLLGACGGKDGHSAASAAAPGSVLHGSIQYTDCSDWRAGSEPDRRATIVSLRGFYGGEVTAGSPGGPHAQGPVLPNQRAYELMQSACAPFFARGFKLYKLYGRAAGFAGAPP